MAERDYDAGVKNYLDKDGEVSSADFKGVDTRSVSINAQNINQPYSEGIEAQNVDMSPAARIAQGYATVIPALTVPAATQTPEEIGTTKYEADKAYALKLQQGIAAEQTANPNLAATLETQPPKTDFTNGGIAAPIPARTVATLADMRDTPANLARLAANNANMVAGMQGPTTSRGTVVRSTTIQPAANGELAQNAAATAAQPAQGQPAGQTPMRNSRGQVIERVAAERPTVRQTATQVAGQAAGGATPAAGMQPVRQTIKNADGAISYAAPKEAPQNSFMQEAEQHRQNADALTKQIATLQQQNTPESATQIQQLNEQRSQAHTDRFLAEGKAAESRYEPKVVAQYYQHQADRFNAIANDTTGRYNPLDQKTAQQLALNFGEKRQQFADKAALQQLQADKTKAMGSIYNHIETAVPARGQTEAQRAGEQLDYIQNPANGLAKVYTPQEMSDLTNHLTETVHAHEAVTFQTDYKNAMTRASLTAKTVKNPSFMLDAPLNYLNALPLKDAAGQPTTAEKLAANSDNATLAAKMPPKELAVAQEWKSAKSAKDFMQPMIDEAKDKTGEIVRRLPLFERMVVRKLKGGLDPLSARDAAMKEYEAGPGKIESEEDRVYGQMRELTTAMWSTYNRIQSRLDPTTGKPIPPTAEDAAALKNFQTLLAGAGVKLELLKKRQGEFEHPDAPEADQEKAGQPAYTPEFDADLTRRVKTATGM